MERIVSAWGKILLGYTPALSIEITRECPLSCPGCYAYGSDHLGGAVTLREVADFRGPQLVEGVLDLVRKYRPLHVSLVGGEPLVRYRELHELLPKMAALGLHTQVVTSAVRPIPPEWAGIPRLSIAVSIDGLQPEHDARRKPATYDRVLKHMAGHQVTVHCTVTRQQASRDGYLEKFVQFWSDQTTTKKIWISLYTPQKGEISAERLTPADRRRVVAELLALRSRFPKLDLPRGLIDAYIDTPKAPDDCIFAKTTTCVSADFERRILPCQFGGNPDCENCGCMASAGLTALGRHRLLGLIPLGAIFETSFLIGTTVRRLREGAGTSAAAPRPSPTEVL